MDGWDKVKVKDLSSNLEIMGTGATTQENVYRIIRLIKITRSH